jgi:hypothetical protein
MLISIYRCTHQHIFYVDTNERHDIIMVVLKLRESKLITIIRKEAPEHLGFGSKRCISEVKLVTMVQ